MAVNEPEATALLLTTCGFLLGVSVLFSRASQRTGLPIALLFLIVGMLAGSEGIGGIEFDNYRFAFRIGVVALALILFDGGLNTPLSVLRRVAAPAGLLATVGAAANARPPAPGGPGWGGRRSPASPPWAPTSSASAGPRRCWSARWFPRPMRPLCSLRFEA